MSTATAERNILPTYVVAAQKAAHLTMSLLLTSNSEMGIPISKALSCQNTDN